MKRALIIAAMTLTFNTLAFSAPTTETNGVLRDSTGHTLYVFAKDEINKSKCSNECIKVWPAFVAKEGVQPSGDLTLVGRDDGTKQWALKGKPLYFYAGDNKAGDINGDGIGGTWSAVRSSPASGKAVSTPSSGY